MRAPIIALGGLTVAAGLLILGLILDGLPGAALVIAAPVVGAVGLGFALSQITGAYRPVMRGLKRTSSGRTTHRRRHSPHRCGHCGGARELRGHVWVCSTCDLGVANRTDSR